MVDLPSPWFTTSQPIILVIDTCTVRVFSSIVEKECDMSRGYALLVGLTSVDSSAYGGWDGRNGCWGCELDVDNIRRIIDPLGFQITTLKTEEATGDAIVKQLEKAAKRLRPEDELLFYFSGHGGQQPDVSGDESDGQDETLVAYDREVIDDELNEVWPAFSAGSRILMFSDSCNSGTNYRLLRNVSRSTPIQFSFVGPENRRSARAQTEMRAQMIHLGGCRDGFSSAGYQHGGAFTTALCNAWQEGAFQGSYQDFYRRIRDLMKGESQQVQYNEYGPVTAGFRQQRPFTLEGPSGRLDDFRGEIEELRSMLVNFRVRLETLEQKEEWADRRVPQRT
jgi:metacaspase-1